MPNNMVLLETIALTQSAASVTFDNLPTSGYTDLKIVTSIRSSRTSSSDGAHIALTFNGNTSSVYSFKHIRGNGSAASSYGESSTTSINLYSQADSSSDTANTFSNNEIYIPNYRSGSNKSFSVDSVYENNATAAGQHLVAGLFASTAAITSIRLAEGFGNNWVAGSTFSLYGVAALGTTPVLAPKATGGNIVANDGTYWYHAFTSSGNFVPQVGLTADVLVIAGGGGGGNNRGGGGGAGGVLSFSSQALANGTNYPCTVGAGGPGAPAGTNARGTNGVDSQFSALTLVKGGGAGGGIVGTTSGNTGGSGGGAGVGGTAGANTSGQGSAGGEDTGQSAGGGGGATAAGSTAPSTSAGGNGGQGTSSFSSWGSVTLTGQNVSGTYIYAGGGGGGTYPGSFQSSGGQGGGGNGGASSTSASAGTAGTGGGGGGSGELNAGGAGGSGIVIIRYPIN
jgi:hypothetical protein